MDQKQLADDVRTKADDLAKTLTAAANGGLEVNVEWEAVDTSTLSGRSVLIRPKVSIEAVQRTAL